MLGRETGFGLAANLDLVLEIGRSLLDEETRAVQLYNPKATAPYQVLIGRGGSVAKERQGYNAGDEKLLEQDIVGLLKQP